MRKAKRIVDYYNKYRILCEQLDDAYATEKGAKNTKCLETLLTGARQTIEQGTAFRDNLLKLIEQELK